MKDSLSQLTDMPAAEGDVAQQGRPSPVARCMARWAVAIQVASWDVALSSAGKISSLR